MATSTSIGFSSSPGARMCSRDSALLWRPPLGNGSTARAWNRVHAETSCATGGAGARRAAQSRSARTGARCTLAPPRTSGIEAQRERPVRWHAARPPLPATTRTRRRRQAETGASKNNKAESKTRASARSRARAARRAPCKVRAYHRARDGGQRDACSEHAGAARHASFQRNLRPPLSVRGSGPVSVYIWHGHGNS